jgi:CHAT domain-containing protein
MQAGGLLRACKRLIAGAAGCLVLGGCQRVAQEERIVLAPVELPLQGDSRRSIDQDLPAGAFTVEVREDGIDVQTSVSYDGGAHEVTEPVPRHGEHWIYVNLPRPARLSIVVAGVDHARKRGTASVRIKEWLREGGTDPSSAERASRELAQALVAYSTGNEAGWRDAAAALERSAALFEHAGRPAERALAVHTLAAVRYWRLNQWQPAARDAATASRLFESQRDHVAAQRATLLEASALLERAVALDATKSSNERAQAFARADAGIARAARSFEEASLTLDHAEAESERGLSLFYRGERAAARAAYERSLALFRREEDPVGEMKILGNLAWLDFQAGDVRSAAAQYESLSRLLDKEADPEQYVEILSNYGLCLVQLGDFTRALDLHNELLEILTRLDDQGQRARQLQHIGVLYYYAGDYARALKTFETALPLREKYADGRGVQATLRLAGNAASELERHDLALNYYHRGLGFTVTPRDRAQLLVQIAGALRAKGDLGGSAAAIEEALAVDETPVRAAALLERGQLLRTRHIYDKAIADLEESERLYGVLSLDVRRIEAATALSKARLASGDHVGALAAADRAIRLIEDVRVKAVNPETRARFLAARYEPYEARIESILDAGKADDRATAAWQALRTAELGRSRSLQEMFFADASARPPEEVRLDDLRQSLTAHQLRLETRLQRYGVKDDEALKLQGELQTIRARLDAAWRAKGALRSAEVEAGLPRSAGALQQLIPPDALVLAYFVGEDASFRWSLARDRFDVVRLPGRAALEPTVDRFIAELQRSRGDASANPTGRTLSRLLIGDVLDGRTTRNLYLLPDGGLHRLPFAALPLRAPNGRATVLVDSHELTVLPSLRVALTATREAKWRGSDALVAIVSDPVYAADDPRFGSGQRVAALSSRGPSGERFADAARLTRLPYSAVEARSIGDAFGAARVVALEGFAARADRILELPFGKLDVLHFATHALARADSPALSALYLSAFDAEGKPIARSRLTLGDIVANRIAANLVVLSGCETADGEAMRGEGVLGLAQGFLAAGSRTVIASLWPVDDQATAAFMRDFYRSLARSGDAASALRAAQLNARASASPAARDPRVWSGFVVQARGFD